MEPLLWSILKDNCMSLPPFNQKKWLKFKRGFSSLYSVKIFSYIESYIILQRPHDVARGTQIPIFGIRNLQLRESQRLGRESLSQKECWWVNDTERLFQRLTPGRGFAAVNPVIPRAPALSALGGLRQQWPWGFTVDRPQGNFQVNSLAFISFGGSYLISLFVRPHIIHSEWNGDS